MWWPLVLAAYLSGSIPFALLVTRRRIGTDIRAMGSGNPGATNVLEVVGRAPAAWVLLLDMAKGLLPVLVGRALGAPHPVLAAAALAAVLGHVLPVLSGLRGGKGVATTFGAFLALTPEAVLGSAVVFALALIWKRYVSLASVTSVASLPLWILLHSRWNEGLHSSISILLCSVAVALIVLARHYENLQRIVDGREGRINERAEVGPR